MLAGCGFTAGPVTAGDAYPGGWLAGESGQTRVWLRRVDGAWRLMATAKGAVEVRYGEFAAGRPGLVRLRQAAGTGADETDLAVRPSQVDINAPLEDRVFVAGTEMPCR